MKALFYLLICLVLLINPLTIQAALEERTSDARSLGMGQASVALSDTHWSIFSNPAGLAPLKNWRFGSSYSKLFQLDELAYSVISAAGPLAPHSGFGLGISSFGKSPYQENQVLVGVGNNLFEVFRLGLAAHLAQVRIASQDPLNGVGLDGGVQLDLGSRFKVAAYFKELAPALPRQWSRSYSKYGFSCQLSNKTLLTSEVMFESGFLPSWRTGAEIWLVENFALRGGMSANPDRFSFGLGLRDGDWRLDYALASHEVLRLTHLFSLNLVWGGP